jgi:hypothetical protein
MGQLLRRVYNNGAFDFQITTTMEVKNHQRYAGGSDLVLPINATILCSSHFVSEPYAVVHDLRRKIKLIQPTAIG